MGSFLTLTILEIVLGVDNVIFISIASQKLPLAQQPRARFIGLSGALVLRILLLLSITWIIGLTKPIATIAGFSVSWRDLLLLGGGLFLIWKASTEIFNEMEPHEEARIATSTSFASVIMQIMVLDLVFSFDSVITAVGIADHVEVMIAAVMIAILVMMVAAGADRGLRPRACLDEDAGAGVPGDGRHGAGGGRPAFPRRARLHLCGDGLRRRGRGAEPLPFAQGRGRRGAAAALTARPGPERAEHRAEGGARSSAVEAAGRPRPRRRRAARPRRRRPRSRAGPGRGARRRCRPARRRSRRWRARAGRWR